MERAVLITGLVPDADDPRWAGAPDPAIVLDRGDAAQLANAIDAVEHVESHGDRSAVCEGAVC